MQEEEPMAEANGKIRVEYKGEPASGTSDKIIAEPTGEEIKARIAEKVRANARERSAMTPAETVFALVPGTRQGNITAILEEIAADDRYTDIKALTTASGRFFFFSKTHMKAEEAIAKSLVEEVKFRIAEKIREDSRDRQELTPAGDLYALIPETEQYKIAAILNEMQSDAMHADIQSVAASTGEVFFYSDLHMSRYYALVLSRVAAKDPCATIAAMVRDESRTYPRPTCVQLFTEDLFGMPISELKGIVEETLKKPEFRDIRMIVHPSTGGVYLYSNNYLTGDQAFALMDWEEVGKDANP